MKLMHVMWSGSIHAQPTNTASSVQWWNSCHLSSLELPQRVGANYFTFGIFLLNDQTGGRVYAIEDECRGKAERIILRILQEWMEGRGLPVTWESLVQTLRDTKLPNLADQIEAAKIPPSLPH